MTVNQNGILSELVDKELFHRYQFARNVLHGTHIIFPTATAVGEVLANAVERIGMPSGHSVVGKDD